eukprot:4538502-Prymnesium_polylepis.1
MDTSSTWTQGHAVYTRLERATHVPLLGLQREPNATRPLIALLMTFPHSGTTWTKRLFGHVSGIASEAIYQFDLKSHCNDEHGVTHGMSGLMPSAHSWIESRCTETYSVLGCAPCTSATALWVEGVDAPALVKSHQHPGEPLSAVPRSVGTEFSSWLPRGGIAAPVTPDVVVRLFREPLEQAVSTCQRIVDCTRQRKFVARGPRGCLPHAASRKHLRAMRSCLLARNATVRDYVRWHCAVADSARRAKMPFMTIDYGRLQRAPAIELRRLLGFLSSNIRVRDVAYKRKWTWTESAVLAAVQAFPSTYTSPSGATAKSSVFGFDGVSDEAAQRAPDAAAKGWLSPHGLTAFYGMLDDAISATPSCRGVGGGSWRS